MPDIQSRKGLLERDRKTPAIMADTNVTSPLPDYENPPIVETVLGVQFDRLARFKNVHLGAFWRTLDRTEWPTVADAPLLPQQFERFVEAARWAQALQFQLTQDPSSRLQIRNKDNDRMIQVQNARLHFNWLKREGVPYPRYERIRDEFLAVLDRFRQFVVEEELGDFRPNQWEVTYLNQIPQGTVWSTPADWGFFRPLRGVPTIESVIEGESFSGEWHFVIPGRHGRLHIAWQHAKGAQKGSDDEVQQFIRLTLTARGPLKGDDSGSIPNGLDLGRGTIVRSFKCLMSDTANHSWRIRE